MSAEMNFLNIHVLTSHSPSCLNRDDMNMQKSAIFGGVRRVRISSQCLKRAMRMSPEYARRLGTPSTRTRSLGRLPGAESWKELLDSFDESLVRRTLGLIAGRAEVEEDTEADAVAPWSVAEVRKLCEIVRDAESEGLDEKKLAKRLQDNAEPLRQAMAHAVDIALFGRMATSGLMSPVDGAMALAHAITTHAVDADVDWFTAVDDLTIEEGETGAGHLNTQEFGAGVFYRYASLNIPQLKENMGGADRAKALETAATLTALLATVVPTGKQQSFAAHNPADLVLAMFADMPTSFSNAFERPVRQNGGGFLKPSVEAFEAYAGKVADGYGLGKQWAVFSIVDTALSPRKDTLADLEGWIRNGGK